MKDVKLAPFKLMLYGHLFIAMLDIIPVALALLLGSFIFSLDFGSAEYRVGIAAVVCLLVGVISAFLNRWVQRSTGRVLPYGLGPTVAELIPPIFVSLVTGIILFGMWKGILFGIFSLIGFSPGFLISRPWQETDDEEFARKNREFGRMTREYWGEYSAEKQRRQLGDRERRRREREGLRPENRPFDDWIDWD